MEDIKVKVFDQIASARTGQKTVNEATNEVLALFKVSERYLVIQWINGNPIMDGSIYFDSKEDCLEYINSIPEFPDFDVEYRICTIHNGS